MDGLRTFAVWIPVVMLSLLFASFPVEATTAADASIFDQVEQLKNRIDEENWQRALTVNEQIGSWYRKNKWKLQFLSYETELQSVERDIELLKIAIQEKDRTESLLILESLHSTLLDIYHF